MYNNSQLPKVHTTPIHVGITNHTDQKYIVRALYTNINFNLLNTPLRCPDCTIWNINDTWHAINLYSTHYFDTYSRAFYTPIPYIGNPLTVLYLQLHPGFHLLTFCTDLPMTLL